LILIAVLIAALIAALIATLAHRGSIAYSFSRVLALLLSSLLATYVIGTRLSR
jgi:hypothetical protein